MSERTSITYEVEALDASKEVTLGREHIRKGGGYLYGPLDLLPHAEIIATELRQMGFKTVRIWKDTVTRTRERIGHSDDPGPNFPPEEL